MHCLKDRALRRPFRLPGPSPRERGEARRHRPRTPIANVGNWRKQRGSPSSPRSRGEGAGRRMRGSANMQVEVALKILWLSFVLFDDPPHSRHIGRMCGRFALIADKDDIEALFALLELEGFPPRY